MLTCTKLFNFSKVSFGTLKLLLKFLTLFCFSFLHSRILLSLSHRYVSQNFVYRLARKRDFPCLKRVHLPSTNYKFDYDSLLKLFVEAPMVGAKKPQSLFDSRLEGF